MRMAVPTGNDLAQGPRLKIERAKHHIADLSTQIRSFLDTKPFYVVRRLDLKARKISFRTRADIPIPAALSLIIGDAAHNLRSALDLAMFALARERSPNSHKIEFPFPRRADGLDGAINAAQVRFAGSKVVDVVTELKPYPGGNATLCELHRLNVRDKHHMLVLARRLPQMTGVELGRLTGRPMTGSGGLRFIGPEDEDFLTIEDVNFGNRKERLGMAKDGIREERTDAELTFEIAFGRQEPFAGQTATAVLNECLVEVNRVVDLMIEAHLSPDNVFP